MPRPVALITGASAGLGRAFCLALAQNDRYDLVLVARREARLEAVAGEAQAIWRGSRRSVERTIRFFPTDLEQHAARERLVARLREERLEVELLINNAGFGTVGAFPESDLNKQERMVALNCIAPVHLTHALLPEMRQKQRGIVLNVCSTAAFQPMPCMATYGASKSFLLSFSLALAAELRRENILVSALCPGPTHTEFHLVSGLPEKLSYLPAMSAEEVVRQALEAIARQQALKVNGRTNRLLAGLSRLLPMTTSARLVESVLRRHR